MRRSLKLTIAASAAAAMLAAGLVHWPISSARVGVEFNRATPPIGLRWRGPERAALTVLPWPTLRIIGVDLLEADGRSLLTAPSARFPLSLVALLRGRFMPTGAMLDNPTALIDLDAAPTLAEERAVASEGDDTSVGAWSQCSSARRRAAHRQRLAPYRHADRGARRRPRMAPFRRAAPLRPRRRLARREHRRSTAASTIRARLCTTALPASA